MADTSSIEWTEATLNPWTGCTKVSPGCAHCYIDRTVPFRTTGRRFEGGHIPLVFHMDRLERMVRRRKPTLYFVNSLSDLFHEDASVERIAQVFDAMRRAPQHTFQVLTKRPERMLEVVSLLCDPDFLDLAEDLPLPNVWLGVTIENRRFVNRAEVLRQTPATVRFISAEPLLGPLIGERVRCWTCSKGPDAVAPGSVEPWGPARGTGGAQCPDCKGDAYVNASLDLTDIDWLIVGGESGKGFRRFDPQWALDLRKACAASGTAFFMKQMGGYRPGNALEDLPPELRLREFPARAREAVAA